MPSERNDSKALIERHLRPLEHERGDRWPILVWQRPPESIEVLDRLADAGISPMFTGARTFRRHDQFERVVPLLQRLQERGMPIVVLLQGLVHVAFTGEGDADHALPARGRTEDQNFRCAARLYDSRRLRHERAVAARIARALQGAGISPAAIWIDFESGAYLRNRYQLKENVLMAMQEAEKCPKCQRRFGPAAFESPEAYREVVDRARASAIRYAFVEPIRSVFPDAMLGNFFAYPHNRIEQPEGIYPAHGYEGSGMNVAQPRCYFIPGWGGGGSSQEKVDWNIFRQCVSAFSEVAEVLRPDEKLVPWVGYLFGRDVAQRRARAGAKIASSEAYREMVRHVLMRGAETIAVFAPGDMDTPLPQPYPRDFDRRELGAFLLNVLDVQQAYDEMLAFHDHLRRGRVLNYEIGGADNRLDETAAVWSGVATTEKALIRTVSFGPELVRSITVFDRDFELPFSRPGRFFWVYPDGGVKAVESSQPTVTPSPGD